MKTVLKLSILAISVSVYCIGCQTESSNLLAGPKDATDSTRAFHWDLCDIWYATSEDGWTWEEQGVAVADNPEGPYVKSEYNPVLVGGTNVWYDPTGMVYVPFLPKDQKIIASSSPKMVSIVICHLKKGIRCKSNITWSRNI